MVNLLDLPDQLIQHIALSLLESEVVWLAATSRGAYRILGSQEFLVAYNQQCGEYQQTRCRHCGLQLLSLWRRGVHEQMEHRQALSKAHAQEIQRLFGNLLFGRFHDHEVCCSHDWLRRYNCHFHPWLATSTLNWYQPCIPQSLPQSLLSLMSEWEMDMPTDRNR